MTPDDKRHGTYAGYKAHGRGKDACDPCRTAAAEYERRRSYDGVLGRTRLVSSTGFRRRLEALQAIGWRVEDIAREMGVFQQNVWRAARRNDRISYRFHAEMVELYERLCMTVPDDAYADRRRKLAKNKGFAPPLAWDDIDNDERPPGYRAPIECGTRRGYERHLYRKEPTCEECRMYLRNARRDERARAKKEAA